MLYTSRISYSGEDKIDITIKSALPENKYFAPTWEMVMGSKKGSLSWPMYIEQYNTLLYNRYATNDLDIVRRVQTIVDKAYYGDITFVCYCTDHTHCHRMLLANWFVVVSGGTVLYGGER